MHTLANVVFVHLVAAVAAWWLISPNTAIGNAVAAATLLLTVAWMRLVWQRRARRLASDFEDLTPNLTTHGPFGGSRWDRRSRKQDEPLGAETRSGASV